MAQHGPGNGGFGGPRLVLGTLAVAAVCALASPPVLADGGQSLLRAYAERRGQVAPPGGLSVIGSAHAQQGQIDPACETDVYQAMADRSMNRVQENVQVATQTIQPPASVFDLSCFESIKLDPSDLDLSRVFGSAVNPLDQLTQMVSQRVCQAAQCAWNSTVGGMVSAVNSGGIGNLTDALGGDPSQCFANSRSNSGASNQEQATPAAFLWQPATPGSGLLTVELPMQVAASQTSVRLIGPDGAVLATGQEAGFTQGNGTRRVYRFGQSGATFPNGVQVEAETQIGIRYCWRIPSAGQRLEKTFNGEDRCLQPTVAQGGMSTIP